MNNIPRFALFNALIFQGLWWTAVLLRDEAVLWMLALLVLHFALSPSKQADGFILPLALIGWLVDGEMVVTTIIHFNSTQALPFYMVLLWIGLVWSFNHSLAWLQGLSWWWLSLIGALAGGLSYYAAYYWGALTLGFTPWVSVALIAIQWAVLLPGLLLAHAYLKRRLAHV